MIPPRKVRTNPDFDRLDRRVLPSSGVTASLFRGTLSVRGTDSADMIVVDLATAPGRRPRSFVKVEGVAAFPAARVRQVVIDGQGGDDFVVVNLSGRPTPVQVFGGAGNDAIATINSFAATDGGTGNNFVNGRWDHPPVATPTSLPPPSQPTTPVSPPTSTALSPIEQQIVDLVNQVRQQSGLAPLKVNARLVQAAHIHAGDMARLNQMQHDLPGAAQPTMVDRANFVGYNYSWLGENIAYNYGDAIQVMSGWMNSPGHRSNILNPNFTEIGVGVSYNSLGEPYYDQTFGAPL